MSQEEKNSRQISQINTNSIQNHLTNGINAIELLTDNISANPELSINRILKRINSSLFTVIKKVEMGKVMKAKFNSISKTKKVISKEKEKESLTLVKDTKKYHALQITIIKKLANEKYESDELINDLVELLENCPIINKFTDKKFFKKEDFDIFIEQNEEKFLFILNIFNVINILNLLWFYTKQNSKIFIHYLDKLGIYLSYVKREEDDPNPIDFVLLTKIPFNLYNYISTYGDSEFSYNTMKDLAKKYSEFSGKSNTDYGLCYQDLTIMNLLNQMEENQYLINDEIMYYFNQDAAEKIINNDLISPPNHYKTSSSTKSSIDEKEVSLHNKTSSSKISTTGEKEVPFQGYNEFDLCLTMLEDVILEKNENFDYIDPDHQKSDTILLKKGITYLFEIKTNINTIIKNFEVIEKHKERFVEAYNNICFSKKKKYNIKNSELVLICNRGRIDAKDKIKLNEEKLISNNKNKQFIFSGSQIGVGIALKLQKNIKSLKNENNDLKEGVDNLKKENNDLKEGVDNLKKENNDLKERANNQQIQISDLVKTINTIKGSLYNNTLLTLQLASVNKISEIVSCKENEVKKSINEKFNFIYCVFNSLSDCFKDLKNNLLFHDISLFLGRNLEDKEEKKKWKAVKGKIKAKINKNNIVSIYYEGLLEMLFGLKHLKKNEKIDYDIYSDENQEFISSLNKLILFTEIFENNLNMKDIESKYQGAVLYIINKYIDEEYINKVIKENLSHRETIKKIISICNSENYLFYYLKK